MTTKPLDTTSLRLVRTSRFDYCRQPNWPFARKMGIRVDDKRSNPNKKNGSFYSCVLTDGSTEWIELVDNKPEIEKMTTKPLDTTNQEQAVQRTPDISVYGNPGVWVCLAKASSKEQGWMKSTKACELIVPGGIRCIGDGCLVQVTTEFRDKEGNVVACSDGVTFVPNMTIDSLKKVFGTLS